MTYTVVLQNPAKPKKTHKIKFYDLNEALVATQSLQNHLQQEMMNRDLPLMYVATQEHGDICIGYHGMWWHSTMMEDGRIVPDDRRADFSVVSNEEIGEKLAADLPEWVYSWSYFLR